MTLKSSHRFFVYSLLLYYQFSFIMIECNCCCTCFMIKPTEVLLTRRCGPRYSLIYDEFHLLNQLNQSSHSQSISRFETEPGHLCY